jgi:uncharacterized tellurite resistance protein B-like protein
MRWLGLGGDAPRPATSETETVRKIIERLDALEPHQARYIAAFAYVLGRVANADRQVTPDELRAIEQLVARHGDLPEAQAVLVVQIARAQNVMFGGTENFLVTREFASIATPQQKLALLDAAFAVSAAQAGVSTVEENEIARIADELLLSHGDYIAVRSRYRDRLNVLRRPGAE